MTRAARATCDVPLRQLTGRCKPARKPVWWRTGCTFGYWGGGIFRRQRILCDLSIRLMFMMMRSCLIAFVFEGKTLLVSSTCLEMSWNTPPERRFATSVNASVSCITVFFVWWTIGDLFKIDRRTVGRVIDRFSSVLWRRLGEFVKLPVSQNKADVMNDRFYQIAVAGMSTEILSISATSEKRR